MTLRDQIKRDEGLRLTPYQDTEGVWTIGYGYNLDQGISHSIAEFMLDEKLRAATLAVSSALPWAVQLGEIRFAVLVGMAYNMGLGSAEAGTGLLGFTKMLAMCQASEFESAAREMLDSRWAIQVGDRAHRLAKQMTHGTWH